MYFNIVELFSLSNKVLDYGKTKQHVKESAENTKKALQGHLMHAKETILRNLDNHFERLCSSIDETVQRDIENLLELEDNLKKEIQILNKVLEEGKSLTYYTIVF